MNHFETYVNAIRKSAHYYSKKWNVDFEDTLSEGYLIYCECVKNNDPSKATFITHLISELRRLNYYCYKQMKSTSCYEIDCEGTIIYKEDESEVTIPYNKKPSIEDILKFSKDELSEFAFEVFSWILNGSWEKKGKKKPSISNVCDEFNVSRNEASKIWEEISNFYKRTLNFAF